MESDRNFDVSTLTRPHPSLMHYYFICSLFAGPFFFFPLIPLYCKFTTLRYKFDDEGVSASWGVFFKREVLLTYRRIQDIHVTRNIVQRWMGLATVSIQTASGSSSPELQVEGVLQAAELRDFLYTKMRGARGLDACSAGAAVAPGSQDSAAAAAPADEALALLRDIRDAMTTLAARRPGDSA